LAAWAAGALSVADSLGAFDFVSRAPLASSAAAPGALRFCAFEAEAAVAALAFERSAILTLMSIHAQQQVISGI
jgi:hypothetical protein